MPAPGEHEGEQQDGLARRVGVRVDGDVVHRDERRSREQANGAGPWCVRQQSNGRRDEQQEHQRERDEHDVEVRERERNGSRLRDDGRRGVNPRIEQVHRRQRAGRDLAGPAHVAECVARAVERVPTQNRHGDDAQCDTADEDERRPVDGAVFPVEPVVTRDRDGRPSEQCDPEADPDGRRRRPVDRELVARCGVHVGDGEGENQPQIAHEQGEFRNAWWGS